MLSKETKTRRVRFSHLSGARLTCIGVVSSYLAVVLPGSEETMLDQVYIQVSKDFQRGTVQIANVVSGELKEVPFSQMCYPVTLDIKAIF